MGQTFAFAAMKNYRGIRLLGATEGSLITNFDTIFGSRSKGLPKEVFLDLIYFNITS